MVSSLGNPPLSALFFFFSGRGRNRGSLFFPPPLFRRPAFSFFSPFFQFSFLCEKGFMKSMLTSLPPPKESPFLFFLFSFFYYLLPNMERVEMEEGKGSFMILAPPVGKRPAPFFFFFFFFSPAAVDHGQGDRCLSRFLKTPAPSPPLFSFLLCGEKDPPPFPILFPSD